MLQATKQNVIVTMIQEETTSESGLILGGSMKATPHARVISVGSQVDCGIDAGDRVLVDWSRVGEFTHEDKKYYVTGQSNIIAVFG